MAKTTGRPLCVSCGAEVDSIFGLQKQKTREGYLCYDCFCKVSPFLLSLDMMTTDRVMEHLDQRRESAIIFRNYFSATDGYKNFIQIDRELGLWCCPGIYETDPDMFQFSDLIDYEVTENGAVVSKGGIGSAVVGGLLFGGVGAVIGSSLGRKSSDVVTRMDIRIHLRHEFISSVSIPIIAGETPRNSPVYQNAREIADRIVSNLAVILDLQEHDEPEPTAAGPTPIEDHTTQISIADEIMKFKNLLDIGAITQEEYDAFKRKLLNL